VYVSRKKLLEILSKKDYILFKQIDLDWSNIVSHCEDNVVAYPEYWQSLVDDERPWDFQGNKYYNSMSDYKEWGYTKDNTRSWETTSLQNKFDMEWENQLKQSLPLSNSISRPTLQQPGNIMPWHQDQFFYFNRQYPTQTEYIARFLVFMNDGGPGQMLQVGNSVVYNWKAGDTILWHPSTMHVAINAGYYNKWTTNVTGILDEQIEINDELDLS
jgi:hypothetical protein